MIDAEEAETRAQAEAAEAPSRRAAPETNDDGPSVDAGPVDAGNGGRRVDFEEPGRQRKRKSPELVADGAVDPALASERVGDLVGVEKAEDTASGEVGSSDAPTRSLDDGLAGDGFGNVAEKADELGDGEGSTLGGGATDDGVTDVRLLEPEDQVGRGHTARREHAAAVSGEVDVPSGADRVSLSQGGNSAEVERSGGSNLNGKAAGDLPHEGGGEGASEAVSRADEDEREPVINGVGLPPTEQSPTRSESRTTRARLAGQTASRSRRARAHHLQPDGIAADSDSRVSVMTVAYSNRPTSLADYLEILHRRIWIVLIPVVLAPILTYVISSREKPVYSASSSVYINLTSATQSALGIFNQAAAGDPTRYFQTEATLARNPSLLNSIARSQGMSPGALASDSSVAPSPVANLLTFTAQTGDPNQAARIANAYARAFAKFQPRQDAQTLTNAITRVSRRIRALRLSGVPNTAPSIVLLRQNLNALQAGLIAVSDNEAQVAQQADGGAQVSPRPKRDAILGLALGLILGVGLAFLAEALDKRVRSEQEIESILGLPLLARLPTPPRHLRQAGELPILVEPRSASAEAVKKLRTNLEFLTLDREARVIMITSALEQEGKSTTIASLAVALARSGRRVALVDLDLRKPYVHRFFQISQVPGVIDVVSGRRELSDALKPVLVSGKERRSARYASSAQESGDPSSLLAVLPAGPLGPDPAFLVGHANMTALLEQLKQDWDFVLVDTPPLPAVDDGLALSAAVDGILVVTKSGAVPRRMLQEMSRLLDSARAEVLGFVLTGLSRSDAYGYGYGYGYGSGGGGAWRRDDERDAAQVIEAPTQDGSDRPRRVWSQR